MKVALVAPTYLPARRANTIQVMKMAQALVMIGHEVQVAVPSPGSSATKFEQYPGWEALAHHYGLQHFFQVIWLPARTRLRRHDYGLYAVLWARRWQADVLYTRLPQAAAWASLAGLATVLEVHDLPQGILGPWFFRSFLRGRGAHRLVVISQALLADLTRRYGMPDRSPFTIVVPDGVDLDRYEGLPLPQEARQSLLPLLQEKEGAGLFYNRFTAGYTGHLYSGRGAEMILSLAAQLPEVNFLMVGGEPAQVSRLRAQVYAQGLDNVILTGFVPNAELPRYQAACEALLMPYQNRVAASSGGDIAPYLSPMKLFEYLACGRAILSSDLPVLREVLSPQNAVLLPAEDVDAWVAAIRELCDNPARRESLAAQARVDARKYTWENRARRIFDPLIKG